MKHSMKSGILLIQLIFIVLYTFVNVGAQIEWEKYQSNPVLTDSSDWALGQKGGYAPSVLIIGGTYHMWYTGFDGTYARIAYATSTDGFTWIPNESNPVLDVGAPGSYEASSVTEPSVIYDGSTFHMWYTGINKESTTWKEAIGYATSPDGVTWTKYSDQPVLEKGSPGSWDDKEVFVGSVIFDGSTFHMWYSGAKIGVDYVRNTGYATSSDGANWTKYANNPVLTPGSSNFWDYPRVAQTKVVYDGNKYHMFYSGYRWFQWRIGYATALNETTWTKYGDSPVLDVGDSGEWDSYHVGIPAVVIDTEDSVFRMWYSGGRAVGDSHIGYAHSIITGIDDNILNEIPQKFILSQNYPNPFNPRTIINYELPITNYVELYIYNLLGQKVVTLVKEKQQAGYHQVEWDASGYASGIYYYKIEASKFQDVKKMILLR